MNFNNITYSIEITDKDGFIAGCVEVEANKNNAMIVSMVREAEEGVYLTPIDIIELPLN